VRFQLDPQSGVLRLSEDVPFNTGRSDLTERTRRTVQVLAEVLGRTLPCFARIPDADGCRASDAAILEAVLVEGHTDRQAYGALAPAQSQQENDRLSTARALTVFAELRRTQPALDLLRNNDGQPLLGVSGYGERRPLPDALGASEADFAQNRRIDLRFILSSRTSDEVRRLIDEIDRLRRQPETTESPAAPETP
jgi:flagellar motor protein MotB